MRPEIHAHTVRALLVLLLLAPVAAASQPLPELEATYEVEGSSGVGEAFTLRIGYKANLDVDRAYRLHVPDLVEVQSDPTWRVQLGKGEMRTHEVRLAATRAAYWSAAIAPEGEAPRGYALHVRTDAEGGASTTGPDASVVIPEREAVLGLTARGVGATSYEATYFAARSGLWRVDEAIGVSLDARAPTVSDGPRADGTTTEEIGPNTYAFRALRAFAVARFERPPIEPPMPDPSRIVACEDFGFRTEDGTFRSESLGVRDCAGLAAAAPLRVPGPGVAALALALALALGRR